MCSSDRGVRQTQLEIHPWRKRVRVVLVKFSALMQARNASTAPALGACATARAAHDPTIIMTNTAAAPRRIGRGIFFSTCTTMATKKIMVGNAFQRRSHRPGLFNTDR